MLTAGMRALGIFCKQHLVDWLVRNGHGRVPVGGYLNAMAQVALLCETHAVVHGSDALCAPALEDAYIG
eukprot:7032900-Karenia_brevis.AAC.1